MKRFNEFIKQLSLTQQLFALIFFFVTFFAVFFLVYVNGSVNDAIKEQIFKTIDDTQNTLVGVNATLDDYSNTSDVENYPILILEDDIPYFLVSKGDETKFDSPEWIQIKNDLNKFRQNNRHDRFHGIYKQNDEGLDSYYSILRLSDHKYLISKTYSNNMYKLEDVLVNSVVNITIIVVGFFFIILMLWVITLIHPLNQIRNYIERVKAGKEATLHVNRKDEIGELADALVSMREELLHQEKTKEEMIHNISHDLKTPIATIKSYGESIKDGIYPYDTLEKSVDVIIENADRLEAKVHSLLYLNRVEYLISQECEGISTNMEEIVDTVVQNTKFIKPEITITTDLEEVWFDGLAEPWRVVVENILENALRYAKSKIVIRLSKEEGLTIANDGPSMDESRIKVLFKPYEKGQGGKFGLGLSIVAKVVNANHYTVCGENTADGVIFRIHKPVDTKKNSYKK